MATDYGSFSWPSSGGSGSNASVGVNGQTAPTSSTEIGGVNPEGNLTPVAVNDAGNLLTVPAAGSVQHVIVDSSALPTGAATQTTLATVSTTLGSILLDLTNGTQITQITGTVPLPTGAATAALQTTGNTSLSSIDTKTPALVAGRVPVDGSGVTQPISAVSLPLPTGASTSALQVSGNTLLTTIASNQTNGTQVTAINNFPATQPVSGTVTANQGTAGASPWVQNLTQVGGAAIALGQAAAASSLPVVLANEDVQDMFVIGQSAQTAVVNNILTPVAGAAATDLTGYRSFSVQVVSTATGGSFFFETSNDNVNFQGVPVYNQGLTTSTAIATSIVPSASSFIYCGALSGRYLRLRILTTLTGGSVQAFLKASQVPFAPVVQNIGQAVSGDLQASVSQGGTTGGPGNAWWTRITDSSSNGPAAVKAASTAAVATDASLVVQLSPNGGTPKMTGLSLSNAPVQNVYSTTNITTAAYTQLIASTTAATTWIDIFDSSGQAMILATGAAASEVIQAYIPPGGDSFSFAIPSGTRVAYKALTANAITGNLLLNLRG